MVARRLADALPIDPAKYILMVDACHAPFSFVIQLREDAAPPPPDPRAPSREAIARLPIPLPDIGIGPAPNQVVVKIPVYLWITNAAPQTATAADRRLSITATAAISSITWSMGEPDLIPGAPPSQHPDAGVPAACSPIPAAAISFTCPGPGAAHPQGTAKRIGYGYTYRWKSLPERTNGTGHWPITASVTWAITWSASTGETGTDTITREATTPVSVGEWTTVLVAGG